MHEWTDMILEYGAFIYGGDKKCVSIMITYMRLCSCNQSTEWMLNHSSLRTKTFCLRRFRSGAGPTIDKVCQTKGFTHCCATKRTTPNFEVKRERGGGGKGYNFTISLQYLVSHTCRRLFGSCIHGTIQGRNWSSLCRMPRTHPRLSRRKSRQGHQMHCSNKTDSPVSINHWLIIAAIN